MSRGINGMIMESRRHCQTVIIKRIRLFVFKLLSLHINSCLERDVAVCPIRVNRNQKLHPYKPTTISFLFFFYFAYVSASSTFTCTLLE